MSALIQNKWKINCVSCFFLFLLDSKWFLKILKLFLETVYLSQPPLIIDFKDRCLKSTTFENRFLEEVLQPPLKISFFFTISGIVAVYQTASENQF
jgi:hypothetical protein